MAHRSIEMLIGRLVTDERFRAAFVANPEATLFSLRELGLDLSPTEVAALVNTDPAVWARAADELDPRLQKATLTRDSRTP
ncbi:MAG: Os1348 family NHLP clan protein [Vicinamibacterales bacterium]